MAIPALTAFLPFVTSGSIFAPRRVDKGLGSTNPVVSIMDYNIAVGQGAKVLEGAANIAKNSSNTKLVAQIIQKEKALEEFLKADKAAETLGKATRFTMTHINPLIGATEAIKAISAENKEEAALTGGLAFGGMIAGETAAKNILGLAKTKYKNGKYEITPREALYKKLPCAEEAVKAIKQACETKEFLGKHMFKYVPTAAKGGLFAAASIGTYALGDKAGHLVYDSITKSDADNVNKAKIIKMTPKEQGDKNNANSEVLYREAV